MATREHASNIVTLIPIVTKKLYLNAGYNIRLAALPYRKQKNKQVKIRYSFFCCRGTCFILIIGKQMARLTNTGRLPIKAHNVAITADHAGIVSSKSV